LRHFARYFNFDLNNMGPNSKPKAAGASKKASNAHEEDTSVA
jgi:hypothetical protein